MTSLESGSSSRLLLCDPVCVFPYGHNVAAINNFRNFIGKDYDEVIALGCDRLPDAVAASFGIKQTFSYYYNDAMPLPGSNEDPSILTTHREKIAAAKADLIGLLWAKEVGPSDTLCYPSIDFYALMALSEAIPELRAAGSPTLLIRLIGVMETAASGHYARPLAVMIALIHRLCDAGLPVKLAAETPRYAEYLAVQLGRPVAVAANIELRQQVALPQADSLTVICPGSARYDKGFLDLLELFTSVRRRDPELRLRFRTQVLPDRDLKYQLDYVAALYAIPGTTLLPAQLAAEDLTTMYEEADIVLLPYAQDVYEYRGSAVLIEAICSGRHCFALDGPAFVDQMRFFGGGTVCSSVADMADKLVAYSQEAAPLAKRHARARQARDRFVRDLAASYRDWIY